MDNKLFGTGFLVNKKYKHGASGFKAVNERQRILKKGDSTM
jgi:hypothetical protein